MTRALPPGLHGFDQLAPGDHLLTDWADVTAEAIDRFADLSGDRFEIHQSDVGAARHGFPAQVAHGLLVLALVEGLKSQSPVQLGTFAALGWDWSFRQPVFAGDRIRAHFTVKAKRAATAGKGVLTLNVSVENQNAEIVQRGEARQMAYRQRQSSKPK